jgi:hypothetical protein
MSACVGAFGFFFGCAYAVEIKKTNPVNTTTRLRERVGLRMYLVLPRTP